MLQGIAKLAGALAWLGGDKYILSGCEEAAGNVSGGIVVIAGTPYRFAGGAKKAKITIAETRETLSAFGVEYPEARIRRTAVFSDTGEYDWSGFSRIPTNLQLKALFESIKGDTPGTVKMWAGQVSKIPVGYRLCDGAELQIRDYPALFDMLGTSFGGNGTSSFLLPDLRGRFVAGFDGTQGSDYGRIGSTGGAASVTLSADQLPEHDHVNGRSYDKLSARAADIDSNNTAKTLDSGAPGEEYRIGGMGISQWREATIQKVGKNEAHENRPPFFTLAYIIKVTD